MSAVYSLLSKKENDTSINCGTWSQIKAGSGASIDYITTGDRNAVIKVWELNDNELTLACKLEQDSLGIVSVAVSPDGHTLASVSMDDNLSIWDLQTGKKVHGLHNTGMDFWSVAFSPSGEFVAAAGRKGDIAIIDVAKCTVERVLQTRERFLVCIAWSPDGNWLGAGSSNGKMHIFNMSRSGVHCLPISAHTDSIRCIAFSPNSKLLATASMDGKVKIFNVKSGVLKGTLKHSTAVMSVRFSRDGARIATSAADGSARVARARPKAHKMDSDDEEAGQTMTSISNGNVKTVFTATDKSGTESLELEVLHTFSEHTETAWSVHFNPEGTKLMSASRDRSINIYGCPPAKKK